MAEQPEPELKFEFIIRDPEHFYRVVYWMNSNVGKTKASWKMTAKTLKYLRLERKPKKVCIRIFEEGHVEEELKVLLVLM